MAAERWIVFMVLASLGGGIYIMSYLVDDESIEKYGKRVAEYNAQHHETVMDVALHREKREQGVLSWGEQDSSNENVIKAGVKGREDGAYPARWDGSTGLHDNVKDHSNRGIAAAKARRSSGQDVVEVVPGTLRQGRSSENVGIEEDLYQRAASQIKSEGQQVNAGDAHPLLAPPQTRTPSKDHPNHDTDRQRSTGQSVMVEGPHYTYRKVHVAVKSSAVEDETLHSPKSTDFGKKRTPYFGPKLMADLLNSDEDNNDLEDQQLSLSNAKVRTNLDSDTSSSESESTEEYEYYESNETHVNSYDEDFVPKRRLLASSSNDDKKLVTFNKGIDFILGLMNSLFTFEGELSVPLPTLNKTFGHGIMQGRFEAGEGFFKNPATLHRTGDVAIVKNGDSVGLVVALGLETLEAGYGHYDLRILKIHQNGTLDVSVAENSIKMKISLTYYPHCKVDVNYLELDKLDGLKVDINGLGAFESMVNMLTKWLTDNFTNSFRLIVNEKLVEKAKKAVAREDICKYFPLSLL